MRRRQPTVGHRRSGQLLQATLSDTVPYRLAAFDLDGLLAPARWLEARLVAAGFSLVDHRLLDADNLRTFERLLS